ncbi:hypothetical protein [Cupriavidus lacunae]|uniref:hypothetical protein n=1 Tax=Cupriavidus lacunae TaxID=2666307 RepID=UPI0010588F16|nr:hypothetical protein [Cupriavidus lacunae]
MSGSKAKDSLIIDVTEWNASSSPEIRNLVIRFTNGQTFDIGARVYSGSPPSAASHHADPDIPAPRIKAFTTILDHLSAQAKSGKYQITSIALDFGNFLRGVDWCDRNEHQGALHSLVGAQAAAESYSSHLSQLVRSDELKSNTAIQYRRGFMRYLGAALGGKIIPQRQVQIIDVTEWNTSLLSAIPNLVIRFPALRTFDIGARAYVVRAALNSAPNSVDLRVDLSSYCSARIPALARFLDNLKTEAKKGEQALTVVAKDCADFLRGVDWCDSNGHSRALHSPPDAHAASEAYSAHLSNLVRSGKLRSVTAESYRRSLIRGFNAALQVRVQSEREVRIIHIVEWNASLSSDLGKLMVRFSDTRTIDIGARAYVSRRPNTTRRMRAPSDSDSIVDLQTFSESRIAPLTNLLEYLSNEAQQGTHRQASLSIQCAIFLHGIDWCDDNGHANALHSHSDALVAADSYSAYLSRTVNLGELKAPTAVRYRNNFVQFLEIAVGSKLTLKSQRAARIIDVTDWSTSLSADIGKLIVRFPEVRTLDIGARAYVSRAGNSTRRTQGPQDKSLEVDLETFSPIRIPALSRLLDCLSIEAKNGKQRLTSLAQDCANFLRGIDWCDRNARSMVLDSHADAQGAAEAYLTHLSHLVRLGELDPGTARQYKVGFVRHLEYAIGDELSPHSLPKFFKGEWDPTEPPDERTQGEVLALCSTLFEQLTSFLLEGRTFPFLITLPQIVREEFQRSYVFPPARLFSPAQNSFSDVRTGRILTKEEFKERYPDSTFISGNQIYYHQCIQEANANLRHSTRKLIGMYAHSLFGLKFSANVAINPAQMTELPWSGTYQVGPAQQGYRAIKYRANEREVHFLIKQVFLPEFKRYLQLRNYLLDGVPFDRLFISFGQNHAGPPRPNKDVLATAERLLKRIKPELDFITFREWRAAKSHFLLQRFDVETTAAILQTSEQSVRRSYAAGSRNDAADELSTYFNEVSIVVSRNAHGADDTPIGTCESRNNPTPIHSAPPVEPDCKHLVGCLFCKHNRLHADAEDARKILSCRHYVILAQPVTHTSEKHRPIFDELLRTLNFIIDQMKKLDTSLESTIESIILDIEENGNMHPYWALKIAMLFDLGAI